MLSRSPRERPRPIDILRNPHVQTHLRLVMTKEETERFCPGVFMPRSQTSPYANVNLNTGGEVETASGLRGVGIEKGIAEVRSS